MNSIKIKYILSLFTFLLVFALSLSAQESGDYTTVIKSADDYYQSKDYYNAKAAYQLASKLKPEDTYPQERIKEIISLLKAEMAVRGQYDDYIELADEAFNIKDYASAISNYQNALNLIAYETHPKERLKEAQELFERAKQIKSSYEAAIKIADEQLVAQQYEKAITSYREAALIDEDQKYPKDQVNKILELLKNQDSNRQAYEQAILKGDQQLNYQKFTDALRHYEEALSYRMNDAYASSQVAKMKDFIEKEIEYDKIAALADELYVNKELSAAKAEYQKALQLLPEKTYALNMISRIDQGMDKVASQKQKLEDDYRKAITDADDLFNIEKYQAAYSRYSKAIELKPSEEYPKKQLQEIDIILGTGYVEFACFVHENNEGLYGSRIKLMEDGDVVELAELGTKGMHKFKLDLNKQYQIRVFKSDYVQKIFDVNTSLPREENHNNIYAYDLSVELFPDCSLDLSILDRPLVEISYYPNKGNFYYDDQRAAIILGKVNELRNECEELREQNAKREEYNKLIASADKDFNKESYHSAIELYTSASLVLPDEEYPIERIAEIKSILEAGNKYDALIVAGDAKYNAKDYENALYDYYEAKNLRPKEAYPQEKINEIDAIINAQKEIDARYFAQIKEADSLLALDSLNYALGSYHLAVDIKPYEQYPKNQIDEIERRLANQKEIDKLYKEAIANADKLFEQENLNDARAAFLIASQIKPDVLYPKYKIEDINTIEEQRRLRALDNDYEQIIAQADISFEKKEYQNALGLYGKAGEIKPKESYPPAQIEIINALLARLEADNQKYDELIAMADQELIAKEYAPSFDNYKLALGIKPEEAYPKQKMAEIEAIMKQLADLEVAYQEAIRQGDAQFDARQWLGALPFYQNAEQLKPNENYPKERIAEINGLLQGLEDQQAAYDAAIAQGDQQFDATEWTPALTSYQTALGIKPNEEYPQNRIAEINLKLKELAALQASYEAVIMEADALFDSQTYDASKAKYQEALSILPNEVYPAQRIAEIDAILKDKDAAYDAAIAQGDQQFDATEWAAALTSYETALGIKPNEEYPQNRIVEINLKLKELADIQASYNAIIMEADALFDSQSYEASKAKYQEALTVLPNEVYPPLRIAEIDGILQAMADKEAAYLAAIQKGDGHFDASEWNLSIAAYESALSIKAEEEYPKNRIAEIRLKLSEEEALEAHYTELIAAADGFFEAQEYLDSKAKYREALALKPNEGYPQDRMAEIDAILKQMADQDALYQQLIASGDALFAEMNYASSLDQFKQASQIKTEEVYPKEKIAEIEALLLQLAENERLYTEAISMADRYRDEQAYELAISKYEEASLIKPNEAYPKDQILLIQNILKGMADQEAAYDNAIAQADLNFGTKEWELARGYYRQALNIKANEIYPQTQIQEIERILQELADIEAAYSKAIANADASYQSEDWQQALSNYQLASQIKPAEQYPKDRIALLNNLLGDLAAKQAQYDALIAEADQLLGIKDYASSIDKYEAALEMKPLEPYPQDQLKAIEAILLQLAELQKQYDALIQEADREFVKEAWSPSLSKYQEALQLKSEEVYPKEQINIINAKLQGMADQQAAYDGLIAEADQFFNITEYQNALAKYEAASAIFSEELYPKERMKEILDILEDLAKKNLAYDKIIIKADDLLIQEFFEKSKLEYQAAHEIFLERTYPIEQMAKIDVLKQKHQQYNQLIVKADSEFDELKYEAALANYQLALSVLPEKEYPANRITEIQALMGEMALKQAAYDAAVQKGDAHFAMNDYQVAKESFQEALSIFSEQEYPQQKILEIDKILEGLAKKRMQYDQLIAQANKSFDEQSYGAALGQYTKASEILPEEVFPKERIAEINAIMEAMADQQGRYDAFVEQGDQAFMAKDYLISIGFFEQAQAILINEPYPPKKIAEAKAELERIQRELDVAYQKAITTGDQNFNRKKWDGAKIAYQEASEIKPEELYPKEKLAEINSILEKELLALQKQYDRYIADGERFYSTKYYQEAILAFEKALGVFPQEKYPADMIEKIYDLIKKNSMVTLLDGQMTIAQNQEEKFDFESIAYKYRSENYILLEVRMVDPQANVKLYVNFGKGAGQNGGYSIPLKTRDGFHSYFVSIGKQPRWVNQDNNYISLLPEGGEVEVKVIKISANGI